MAGLRPGVLVAVLLAAAAAPASAKDYTVGDSSGWTTGVDYTAWAKGKTFNIGDTLLFQYTSAGHSVVEVSEADHSSCSAANPLRSYKDGTTIVTLTRPGTRYFICGSTGHCGAGMKLTVTVASLSGSGSATGGTRLAKPSSSSSGEEAPSAADPTTTTRTSSTTSGATTGRWARPATWLLFVAVLGLARATLTRITRTVLGPSMAQPFLALALCVLLVHGAARTAEAASYNVGNSAGWDISADFPSWLDGKAFYVGDSLVFQYSKYHTLSEVDEAGYRNCSTTNAVLSSSDGNTTVPLTAPGDRYFVCGNELHCLGGMRLHVLVSEPASPAGAPAGATPASG
uniref:Phytocyanin domain-containing protein n=1 Tax=Oryza punctata TaxID=4537 RepID=A0A0E0KTG6_ORYPU